ALHGVVRKERARVEIAAVHDDGPADRYLHRAARGRPGAVAELAVVVAAPAQQGGVGHEHAGVIAPGGDGGRVSDPVHGVWNEGVGGGPVTELPVDVAPPALHRAVGEDRAAVPGPGSEGGRGGDA